MIEVQGAKVEDIRAMLPYYIKVWQDDKNTVIFNTSPLTLRQIKEKYGESKVTVKNSDEALFHEAINGQPKLNCKRYTSQFPEAKTARVIIRSTPQEAYNNETAIAWAKAVIEATTKATRANFTVRGWLFTPFRELTEKNDNIYIRHAFRPRDGVLKPRDKAIVYTGVMDIADLESVVEQISKMERVPSVAFSNPEVPRKQRERRQPKKNEAKPERGINKERKVPSKQAEEQKKEDKPKRATVMIMLEKGYAEKLLDTIKNVAKDCNVRIVKTNILVTIKDGNVDDVVSAINRIKVNKKELTLSIRK